MKKILLATLITVATTTFASDTSGHWYGTTQMLGGHPMVGLGTRNRIDHNGFDFSTALMPVAPSIFHAKMQYLFFPMKEQGLYLGTGVGLLNEPETISGISGSFEPALGYQWETKGGAPIFIEANAIAPFKKPGGASRVWPGLSFGFGF